MVRFPAPRSFAFSLLNAFSIGLRSGLYGGRNRNSTTASIAARRRPHRRPLVARQVVHHHDVPGPQHRDELLLDVGHEHVAGHRPMTAAENADSAAVHLENALSNATNKHEQARWEYLLAQLYEMSGRYKDAENYYSKAISHTTDPILDIYARLYMIRVNKDGGDNYIEKNIATLVKMAKKDKYQDYRDIIYYMAAQMELERNNIDGALSLLEKSTKYTSNEPSLRNKAFLQLAELSYAKHHYRQAYNYYDSLRMDDPALKDPEAITKRKTILGNIANSIEIIERQDSLQRIANMPEEDRKDFVKRIVRQLRKAQGLKDEGICPALSPLTTQPPPMFPGNDPKGGWYFDNPNSRQKGLAGFKSKWGTRPNQDNWRRSAALSGIIRNNNNKTDPNDPVLKMASNKTAADEPGEITFDALYAKLPLTPELLKQSTDSLAEAMFNLGIAYIQGLEDCAIGTRHLKSYAQNSPIIQKMDEILFNLYYCYHKNGETEKADAIKKLMTEKFSKSNFTTIVTTGKNPQSKQAMLRSPKCMKAFMIFSSKENLTRLSLRRKLPIVFTAIIIGHHSFYTSKQYTLSSSARIVLQRWN